RRAFDRRLGDAAHAVAHRRAVRDARARGRTGGLCTEHRAQRREREQREAGLFQVPGDSHLQTPLMKHTKKPRLDQSTVARYRTKATAPLSNAALNTQRM